MRPSPQIPAIVRSYAIPPPPSDRILWYQGLTRYLLHLHSLGISHSDIRERIVYSLIQIATLVLVTLAHAAHLDTLIRLCQSFLMEDATNRFAMGSMVYKLETGVESKISIEQSQ
ncbi:hypothetical protein I7I48_00782 [Histoplasma ohiense]|nr:hypothetical protein I7I48_00782 [Histoplasma ohiense (nom. inval.)]